MKRALRILVVGAGHMGSLHAEKVARLAQLEGSVALAGVADVLGDRARALAERFGVAASDDALALAHRAEAAIVAVPAVHHHEVVCSLLERGLDVLVEKPIAATVEQAEGLMACARRHERVLEVGHLEWFNGGIRAILDRVHRPRFVEAHRLGPFPARATDVGVVHDLMIHDIDIVQRLLGEEPERIEAVGVPVLSQEIDIANARMSFPSGCVANFTASRVSLAPMRKIRFFQADAYFSIDFRAQSAVIARRKPGGPAGAPPSLELERVSTNPDDALLAQLRAFVAAVRERDLRAATAEAALRALRTALRVVAALPSLDELA